MGDAPTLRGCPRKVEAPSTPGLKAFNKVKPAAIIGAGPSGLAHLHTFHSVREKGADVPATLRFATVIRNVKFANRKFTEKVKDRLNDRE